MQALSGIDAIQPAIARTREFLVRPFRLGTYLKLCLVACLSEGMGGSLQFSGFGNHGSSHRSPVYAAPHSMPALTPAWTAALVAVMVLLLLVGAVVSYLLIRLRFAYFHCLVHNIKEVRPGWRHYRTQATRFFWLNVAIGFSILLVALVVAIPFVAGFWRLFHNLPHGGQPNMGAFLTLLLPLLPILVFLGLLSIAATLILCDGMLPHYALEDATAAQAWRAVWSRIRAEKSAFFVYALLRVILPIAAGIAVFLVLLLPVAFGGAAIVVLEVMLHKAFAAGSVAAFFGLGLQALVLVIAIGLLMVAVIAVFGPICTAVRQYALLFYGSRYQPLRNLLWAAPPGTAPLAPEAL